jgi:hypothetical protein
MNARLHLGWFVLPEHHHIVYEGVNGPSDRYASLVSGGDFEEKVAAIRVLRDVLAFLWFDLASVAQVQFGSADEESFLRVLTFKFGVPVACLVVTPSVVDRIQDNESFNCMTLGEEKLFVHLKK